MRRCLGVIQCENLDCQIVQRTPTTKIGKNTRLEDQCACGADLFHQLCNVTADLWTWKEGIHYENHGYHKHLRPGHVLHLLPDEQARFHDVVKRHPKAKPLELLVGPSELGGPGESVASISPALYNTHRISKERQKLKKTIYANGGDGFNCSIRCI